jgi:TonB family protein
MRSPIAAALLVALACAPAATEPADHHAEVADKVTAALAHRDAVALASEFAVPLTYEGFPRSLPTCEELAGGGTVTKQAELVALATCLIDAARTSVIRVSVQPGATAATHVVITPRPITDPAADAVAATLAKAIQAKDAKAVAAALVPPFLYSGVVTKDDACKRTFRSAGKIDDSAQLVPFATCLLAVDGIADYAVVGRSFPPHVGGGADHAVLVFVDPDARALKAIVIVPKRDPNAPAVISPKLLEGQRIKGDPRVAPDLQTAKAIHKAGVHRVIASVKICLNAKGDVSSAEVAKSSGFPAYDQELTDAIATWKYKPWTVDGMPAAVCTAITFIYQQS